MQRWATLQALLAAHPCADDKEARDVAFIRDFLSRFPDDAHLRTRLEGHLTGSAFVVDHAREHVLLLHHARLDRWLQPGGHGEGETDIRLVALRELAEETGLTDVQPFPFPDGRLLDVDVHAIPENPKKREPAHVHLDLRWGFLAAPGAQPRLSDESRALQWVPLDTPLPDADPSLRRALGKLRRNH